VVHFTLSTLTLCYTLNQGGKDHKCTPGPIMLSGSNEQTRTRRLSAMRELQLQPMKVMPLAPMCSPISECQDTKSCGTQRGRQIRESLSSKDSVGNKQYLN